MLYKILDRIENMKNVEFLINAYGRQARTGYFTRQEELDAEEIKDLIALKNSLWKSMITPIPMFPSSYDYGGELVANPATAQAYIDILTYEKELKSQYKNKYGRNFDRNSEYR